MAGVHEDFMEISDGVMLGHRTEDDRSPDQKKEVRVERAKAALKDL